MWRAETSREERSMQKYGNGMKLHAVRVVRRSQVRRRASLTAAAAHGADEIYLHLPSRFSAQQGVHFPTHKIQLACSQQILRAWSPILTPQSTFFEND